LKTYTSSEILNLFSKNPENRDYLDLLNFLKDLLQPYDVKYTFFNVKKTFHANILGFASKEVIFLNNNMLDSKILKSIPILLHEIGHFVAFSEGKPEISEVFNWFDFEEVWEENSSNESRANEFAIDVMGKILTEFDDNIEYRSIFRNYIMMFRQSINSKFSHSRNFIKSEYENFKKKWF